MHDVFARDKAGHGDPQVQSDKQEVLRWYRSQVCAGLNDRLGNIDAPCGKHGAKKPEAIPEEVLAHVDVSVHVPRVQHRREEEQHDRVQGNEQVFVGVPVFVATPPEHAPPDQQDVDENIYRPQRVRQIRLCFVAMLDQLRRARGEVRDTQAHDD